LKKLFYIVVLLSPLFTSAQPYTISDDAEISIITVGPGKNLYDKFGHSAFRVKDDENGIDWAYNYGTYDFNTPNFYTKFAQGKLLYSLSVGYFESFFKNYVAENRWVKEQVLQLNSEEKKALFRYLQSNAKPENKDYQYDFIFDNCATRIRDVLVEVLKPEIQYNDSFVKEDFTFRQLIQKNVPANSWGSLGMDVAIGAVVDRKATAWQYQFLPQYVYEAAAVATLKKGNSTMPLVKETTNLFQNDPQKDAGNFFVSPLFLFGVIGLLILFLTYKDYRDQRRSRLLDGLLFGFTGLIGLFLLLLWFATDHTATALNYNLLWAFPLSLFLAPLMARSMPPKWIRKYVFLLLLMMSLMVLHAFTGVQQFAIGFIPLFGAMFIRYLYVWNFLKK
jgi:Domain of unknown function (DUF4105)